MQTRGKDSRTRRRDQEEMLPSVRTTNEESTELAPGQAERMHGDKAGTEVGKHSKNGWNF